MTKQKVEWSQINSEASTPEFVIEVLKRGKEIIWRVPEIFTNGYRCDACAFSKDANRCQSTPVCDLRSPLLDTIYIWPHAANKYLAEAVTAKLRGEARK